MQASGTVLSVAVSQDGRWIVSGDDGKKAIVWNALTNEKVRHAEYRNSVYAVDISSDCTKVVAASYDDADNVLLFGITSGQPLLPPISHEQIWGAKFSPDGSRFATVSCDSGFRVYSTYDGEVLFDSGTQGSTNSSSIVTPLAWSSDGQQLFIASKGKITSFNVSNSSSSEWPIHDTGSYAYIASNGKFIACSAGSSVSLWDCMSRRRIGSIITHTAGISCIALSPSGRYLACGVSNNITIHDLKDILPLEYFGSGLPLVEKRSRELQVLPTTC
ncbi:hypothetical protein PISMIDRAFT_321530 [Pisolithus microcarpus 441]|uniref:Uncharacterized protein n=1 Tax=Pisolithus microcarpus 441 TaxID=765257 RepID=A0A0C9XT86_9AGAM|nr:hypothetical protein PISMIDRAFT_321530 [Pisolithus microcarpus 441]